jgi:hypothetical protein
MPKAMIALLIKDVPEVSFCDKESDIRRYLMLMTNVVTAISRSGAPAMIRFVPANCPAEVRLVNEMTVAIQGEMPPLAASRPNVKATGTYPRAMGIPFRSPYRKSIDALLGVVFVMTLSPEVSCAKKAIAGPPDLRLLGE